MPSSEWDDMIVPLTPGNYAFGERAVIRVRGFGPKAFLWIGLDNRNSSCLGVIGGSALTCLLARLERRRPPKKPRVSKEVPDA